MLLNLAIAKFSMMWYFIRTKKGGMRWEDYYNHGNKKRRGGKIDFKDIAGSGLNYGCLRIAAF